MRVTSFIILALTAFLGPYWLFLAGAVLYAFWQRGYELMLLAVFVDAQFGTAHAVIPYVYTLSMGALIFIAEFVKPHLSFYES